MDCKEFRNRFEEEAGEVRSHAEECPECASYEADEKKLTGLLRSLPAHDAPMDFREGVRVRIAKSGSHQFWQVARIALPAAAMVLILGFVVYESNMFDQSRIVPEVAVTGPDENSPQFELRPIVEENDKVQSSTKEEDQTQPKRADDDGKPGLPEAETSTREEDENQEAKPARKVNRSLDMAAEESEVSNPAGIDPDKRITKPKPVAPTRFFAAEVLATLGISASWSGNGYRVSSVAANSVAERIGVEEGDLVVSIDGVPVSEQEMSGTAISGRRLRVVRNGKGIDLRFANRKE